MHRIWERARERTHTLAALGRGAPHVPAWPRWSAARGCRAGQPGWWDCSRLLAAHASKEAGRSPGEAAGLMPRGQTCKGGGPCSGHSWDPRSSRTPALQSLSPASAQGCCASGARQRGSPLQCSARSPATVTTGSVVHEDVSAVTDWGQVLQS